MVTAYWTLDQATLNASQLDSVGVHDLVATSLPIGPGVPAKFSNGVQFDAVNCFGGYFAASGFDYVATQSFSYWFWVKINAADSLASGVNSTYVSFSPNASSALSIDFGNADNPGVVWVEDRDNDVYFNISIGAWHFFHVFFDANILNSGYSIDGGTEVLLPNPTTQANNAHTDVFLAAGSLGGSLISVIFDELGLVVGNKLTLAQVSYLYNGGTGRTWPITLTPIRRNSSNRTVLILEDI